jgi:hypothetical protein
MHNINIHGIAWGLLCLMATSAFAQQSESCAEYAVRSNLDHQEQYQSCLQSPISPKFCGLLRTTCVRTPNTLCRMSSLTQDSFGNVIVLGAVTSIDLGCIEPDPVGDPPPDPDPPLPDPDPNAGPPPDQGVNPYGPPPPADDPYGNPPPPDDPYPGQPPDPNSPPTCGGS